MSTVADHIKVINNMIEEGKIKGFFSLSDYIKTILDKDLQTEIIIKFHEDKPLIRDNYISEVRLRMDDGESDDDIMFRLSISDTCLAKLKNLWYIHQCPPKSIERTPLSLSDKKAKYIHLKNAIKVGILTTGITCQNDVYNALKIHSWVTPHYQTRMFEETLAPYLPFYECHKDFDIKQLIGRYLLSYPDQPCSEIVSWMTLIGYAVTDELVTQVMSDKK